MNFLRELGRLCCQMVYYPDPPPVAEPAQPAPTPTPTQAETIQKECHELRMALIKRGELLEKVKSAYADCLKERKPAAPTPVQTKSSTSASQTRDAAADRRCLEFADRMEREDYHWYAGALRDNCASAERH